MLGPVLFPLPSLFVAFAAALGSSLPHGLALGAPPAPVPAAPAVLPPALPKALAPAPKKAHRADLVLPKAGQDHSAFRYDSEVFGWNNDFSEVGSVSMQVVRGPQGRHRGEVFMLVYPVGEWLPKHNIICHNVTHVDLPDNPVPMEQAEDYLWAIEHSFLQMWPNRPMRRAKRGFMRVTPLTAFLPEALTLPVPERPPAPAPIPAEASGATEEAEGEVPPLVRAVRREAKDDDVPERPTPLALQVPGTGEHAEQSAARCRPWVSFVLDWHGQRRLQPFVPLDMGARCGVLRRGETARTYWGRADVAASMVRVDFNANPDNEESARFVASAAWRLGRSPKLEVADVGLSLSQRRQLVRTVREMGGHAAVRGSATASAPAAVRVRGPRAWLPWGGMCAEALGVRVARYVVDDARPDVVSWERASPEDAEAPAIWAGGAAPAPAPTNAPAPARSGGGAPSQPTPPGLPVPLGPRPPRPVPPGLPPVPSAPRGPAGADGGDEDAEDPEQAAGKRLPPPPASEPAPSAMPAPAAPSDGAPPPPKARYLDDWRP